MLVVRLPHSLLLGLQTRFFSVTHSGGPLNAYNELLAKKKIRDDEYQRVALTKLQDLHESLRGYDPPLPVAPSEMQQKSSSWGWVKRFTSKEQAPPKVENAPKGVYLHGDVGCGKSFLMDLFYENSPHTRKRRVHFHHFMQDVHKRLHEWRMHKSPHAQDPLPKLAAELTRDAWLLCFDEFQVTDVADAMILHRLFVHMFNYGAVLVSTSNRHPNDLYKGGLQRDLFLPFIALLQKKCLVHDINSGQDYRLSGHKTTTVFITPITPETDKQIEDLFKQLSHNEPIKSEKITAHGRTTVINKAARNVAMFDFEELCGAKNPLGVADYIDICQKFHTVVVKNIPKMSATERNEARRFIMLIDVLYEHKVKFICSASVPGKELFVIGEPSGAIHVDEGIHSIMDIEQQKAFSGEEELFMFARCCSRIEEMQTDDYLRSSHAPPK